MCQRTLNAVTVGLCLAMLSLAGAGRARAAPSPASKAKDIDAVRRRLQDHLALTQVVSQPHQASVHLNLLQRHQVALLGDAGARVRIAGDDQHAIELVGASLQVVAGQQAPRNAEVADLVRAQITSAAAFQDAVAGRVLQLAGIKGKATDEKALSQATTRLQGQIGEAQQLTRYVQGNRWLRTLSQHHDSVTLAKKPGIGDLELASNAAGALVVGNGRVWYDEASLPEGGQRRAPTRADLASLGITSVEQFDALIEKKLRSLAGVRGKGERATEQAVQVLSQQMQIAAQKAAARAQELRQIGMYLQNPAAHADLKLLLDVKQSLSASGPPLRIAADKTDALELAIVSPKGQRVIARMDVVSLKAGTRRVATPADLDKFKLNTQARFDAAAARALTSIAPEDLP